MNRAATAVAFAAMTDFTLSADSGARPPERRRNAALRELIDEMLASIRTAANRDLWTPDERAQYERELAEIMARVRSEAVNRAG
ncbi:hypothetical protein tb265_09030 [Gemmatimonadetes bacterium T265]|nr:hypothetical protein tb265_09030 [Gemmatimonadetes bacterium T265]